MNDLKAAYDFLKVSAFYDMPTPSKMRIERKRLRVAWGYYSDSPRKIEIATFVKTGDQLLKVMAHEMVHATLNHSGACDWCEHSEAFKAIADTVCKRMGWKAL